MDEELGGINPDSFFEQLTEVRETAQSAQKTSNSNLSLLNELRSKVEIISNDLRLLKNEAKDKAFEEEDRKQKEKLENRAKSIAGESQGSSEDIEKEEGDPEKGLLGQIGDFISNLFGGLVGGIAGLAISGIGGLIDLGTRAVSGAKRIGAGIADALTFNMFDFDKKGKPDKKNLSSIMGGDKDYEKNRKKNLDLKEEVKKELEDDLGVGDKEKNKRGSGKDLKEEIKGELKEELGLGDKLKETGKNILGGIKKTFGGIKDAIGNFDGRPGSRDTKYEGVKSDNEKYGDTMPDGAFGIGSKSTDSFSSEKEVIKKEESFSMPKGKKTSFSDALSGNRNIIHQFLFEQRLSSAPPGEAFNDFSGNPAYDSDVDTFLRGLKDSPQGYGIEINSGRVYLSKEKASDGGYTIGRDNLPLDKLQESDNAMYGDTFPKRSFSESKKNTYERSILEFNEGGVVQKFDEGGEVDSVPAMLTPGEFVVTKNAVQKVGVDTLKGLNASVGDTNKPKLSSLSIDFGGGDMSLFEKKQTSYQGMDLGFTSTSKKTVDGEVVEDITKKEYLTPTQTKQKLTEMGIPYKELLSGTVIPDAAKMGAEKMPEFYRIAKEAIMQQIPDDLPGIPAAARAEYQKLQKTALKELDKFMTKLAGGGDFTDTSQIEAEMNRYIPGTIENLGLQIGDEAKSKYNKSKKNQGFGNIAQKFNEGGLVTPINESVSPSNKTELELIDAISQSVTNNSQSINIINQQNDSMDKPNNQPAPLTPKTPPNISEAEVKDTTSPIPFVNLLRLNSQRYLNLGNDAMVIS